MCLNYASCKLHTWRRPPHNECDLCRPSQRGKGKFAKPFAAKMRKKPAAGPACRPNQRGLGKFAKALAAKMRKKQAAGTATVTRPISTTREAHHVGHEDDDEDDDDWTLALEKDLWSKLPLLRTEYGDVSALKILAAALAFHGKLRELPLLVVSSPIAVASILSIGVALGADAVSFLQGGAAQMAERYPVQRLAGDDQVQEVQDFEAKLFQACFASTLP